MLKRRLFVRNRQEAYEVSRSSYENQLSHGGIGGLKNQALELFMNFADLFILSFLGSRCFGA